MNLSFNMTNAGKALLINAAHTGVNAVTFTTVALGTGKTDADGSETALIAQAASTVFAGNASADKETIAGSALFTGNAAIAASEIGIFGKVGSGAETLIFYTSTAAGSTLFNKSANQDARLNIAYTFDTVPAASVSFQTQAAITFSTAGKVFHGGSAEYAAAEKVPGSLFLATENVVSARLYVCCLTGDTTATMHSNDLGFDATGFTTTSGVAFQTSPAHFAWQSSPPAGARVVFPPYILNQIRQAKEYFLFAADQENGGNRVMWSIQNSQRKEYDLLLTDESRYGQFILYNRPSSYQQHFTDTGVASGTYYPLLIHADTSSSSGLYTLYVGGQQRSTLAVGARAAAGYQGVDHQLTYGGIVSVSDSNLFGSRVRHCGVIIPPAPLTTAERLAIVSWLNNNMTPSWSTYEKRFGKASPNIRKGVWYQNKNGRMQAVERS